MSSQIAPVTSDALASWIGARTVAIAYDRTQNYTREVSRSVRSELESRGVKVTAFEPVQPGKNDYSDVVDKLASDNPDAIYAAVYSPEGALVAKAMGTLTSRPTCLLDYASYDTGYVQDAGQAAAGNCDVVGVPAPDDFKGSATHVSEYQDQFGEAPGHMEPIHVRLSERPGLRGQAGGRVRHQGLDQRARRGAQLEGLDGLGHPRPRKRQSRSRDGDGRSGRRPGKLQRRSQLGASGRRAVLGIPVRRQFPLLAAKAPPRAKLDVHAGLGLYLLLRPTTGSTR